MTGSTRTYPGGLFVSFEGPEGAGKSTQVSLLAEHLKEMGYRVLPTREPGGTRLGEELRVLAKHMSAEDAPCPIAELLIMGASRAQHTEMVIKPFLATGGIVLCDRYADSTTVYQGIGRGLDMAFVHSMHKVTTQGCWPRLTILLDVPPEVGLKRSRRRQYAGGVRDRFEDEPADFHLKIREGFLALARAEPDRFRVFSSVRAETHVHDEIVREVEMLVRDGENGNDK
jgi:dTMP kinase